MGDILQRLQDLHLAACRKVKPDPEELAARLFDRELNGQWDVFYGAAATYASILGERGLAVYRRLAEEEWKKIKPLGPSKEERRAHTAVSTLRISWNPWRRCPVMLKPWWR